MKILAFSDCIKLSSLNFNADRYQKIFPVVSYVNMNTYVILRRYSGSGLGCEIACALRFHQTPINT